jgi:HEAT repeat protein
MWDLIFGVRFDWQEFVLGLLVGLGLTFALTRGYPFLLRFLRWSKGKSGTLLEAFRAGAADRYRTELLDRLQASHIAKALFSLDDIVIEPRLLAPTAPTDPLHSEPVPEHTLSVLPTLLDWNILAGIYASPTLSFGDALAKGANLLVTGELGAGKSVALAHLAIHAARRDPATGRAAELLPVLVHGAELRLEKRSGRDPLEPLVAATQQTASASLGPRLPAYLKTHFKSGQALLLLDGLDEMAPAEVKSVTEWLAEVLGEYPGNRVVVAGPAVGHGGLTQLGLVPVPLAPWNEWERKHFLSRWSAAWQRSVSHSRGRLGELDPALLIGWMSGTNRGLTPLELTVRAWSAFAGDVRGSRVMDHLEAFMVRLLSSEERQMAEGAALAWITEKRSTVAERTVRRFPLVDDLVEAGLLVKRSGARFSFMHPAIGAFLASRAMERSGIPDGMADLGWLPAEAALSYFAASGDVAAIASALLQVKDDPLERRLLTLSKWIREAPPKAEWRGEVLRSLAVLVQNNAKPFGLRLRAVHALARAAEGSVGILYRRLLALDTVSSRILGALGVGSLRDAEAIPTLLKMVASDPETPARHAACLALAAIGTEASLEGLGRFLLKGDESTRLAAAEAIACDPYEGYGMLREAAEIDDSHTRRAAVFGLSRVHEDWAADIIQKIMVDDKQWVVRGAAAEALERKRSPMSKIQPAPRELSETPWLVAFAAKQGVGIASGKASLEMLRKALTGGSAEEKTASLEAISSFGLEEFGLEIQQGLSSPEIWLRDAAYETLYRLEASGKRIPAPATPA